MKICAASLALHFLPFLPMPRLKLKPSLTWDDVKTRLDREFDRDDEGRHDLYAPLAAAKWTPSDSEFCSRGKPGQEYQLVGMYMDSII